MKPERSAATFGNDATRLASPSSVKSVCGTRHRNTLVIALPLKPGKRGKGLGKDSCCLYFLEVNRNGRSTASKIFGSNI